MDCTSNTVCRLHFTYIVSIVLLHWKNNASVVTLPLFLNIYLLQLPTTLVNPATVLTKLITGLIKRDGEKLVER